MHLKLSQLRTILTGVFWGGTALILFASLFRLQVLFYLGILFLLGAPLAGRIHYRCPHCGRSLDLREGDLCKCPHCRWPLE